MAPPPPTLAQQRGLAYAPVPFALASLVASLCVVRHVLRRDARLRLPRQAYYRLVLAMNVALVGLAAVDAWGTWAVPAGTPGYAGAPRGTVGTCTAQGFVNLVLAMTVPIYYGSLSLQACLAVRHGLQEQEYRHLEKWIHLAAWCVPCALAAVVAATDNVNPGGSGCWVGQAPYGCDRDPDVECARGGGVDWFVAVFGLGQVFLYLVFPPACLVYLYCGLRRRGRVGEDGREAARRGPLMQRVTVQLSMYLLAFWFTFLPGLVFNVILGLTSGFPYDFFIFANVVFATQGVVFAGVYFTLEGTWSPAEDAPSPPPPPDEERRRDGDAAAAEGGEGRDEAVGKDGAAGGGVRFNVFCPDVNGDSPWAEFFRDDEEAGGPTLELPPQLQWRPEEGDADKNLDLKTKLYLSENVLRI